MDPLDITNPTNPLSPLNPGNPASPISPLNPMNPGSPFYDWGDQPHRSLSGGRIAEILMLSMGAMLLFAALIGGISWWLIRRADRQLEARLRESYGRAGILWRGMPIRPPRNRP